MMGSHNFSPWKPNDVVRARGSPIPTWDFLHRDSTRRIPSRSPCSAGVGSEGYSMQRSNTSAESRQARGLAIVPPVFERMVVATCHGGGCRGLLEGHSRETLPTTSIISRTWRRSEKGRRREKKKKKKKTEGEREREKEEEGKAPPDTIGVRPWMEAGLWDRESTRPCRTTAWGRQVPRGLRKREAEGRQNAATAMGKGRQVQSQRASDSTCREKPQGKRRKTPPWRGRKEEGYR